MEMNLVVLLLFGLLGILVSRIKGLHVLELAVIIVAYLAALFLVIIPLLSDVSEAQSLYNEARSTPIGSYLLPLVTFIENQSVGWVIGYVASSITGAIIGLLK